jgi:type I restriction enzyme, S subunit
VAVWSTLKVSTLAPGTRLDSEYYHPRYLKDVERLQAFHCRLLGSMAFVTDGIHGSPDEVDEGGIRYLSAKCVKDNDFSLGDTLWISKTQHKANPRTSLKESDVLLTTVGTIGNAAVVQPDLLPANADRHLGIIRLSKDGEYDPYFVAAFLNSEFGRFQTLREATGNVQLNLFIEKIKTLKIPRLRCARDVSALVRSAYAARLEAAKKVSEAEKAVIRILRLKGLDLSPSKTYTLPLSALQSGKRFGAEFYMPAKYRALESLGTGNHQPLSAYVDNARQAWNPDAAIGDKVRNFDLTHAMEPFLDDRVDPVQVSSVGSTKKRLQFGDVVISRLRSYLKQIAVVRCSDAPIAVGSSEFIVLRPKGDLRAETLLAFLRSDLVQTILRWSQDGTNHPRFDEDTLLSIPVPDTILKAQGEIAGAVDRGIAERQAMIELLRKAKGRIEHEIIGRS